MSFAAPSIWHNWSTGAVGNGGGVDPANANFATDGTVDTNTGNTSAPVFSSASYNFVAGDVGAWLFRQDGAYAGWYQIASVASNKATLTAGIGTAILYGTSITGRNYHRPNGLNTAVGIDSTGTPTGIVWNVDYSQQTAAKTSYTDMVVDPTTNTNFTSVLNPPGINIVGNIINVTSGTGFTVQRVQVVSVTGSTATVDKSLGTLSSVGGNGALGGAIGSSSTLTALTQALVAGNKVYVKATGTYTVTVTTTVTASAKGDITNGRISVEGFTTYPGDRAGRPLITSATNSVALITVNDNDYFEFIHLRLTHTAATRGIGVFNTGGAAIPTLLIDMIFDGLLNASNNGTYIIDCEVMNCTSHAFTMLASGTTHLYGCDVHDNVGNGINSGSTPTVAAYNCFFDTNAIGIAMTNSGTPGTLILHNCTLVDNTGDAVDIVLNSSTVSTFEFQNNVIYGNGGEGIDNNDDQSVVDANMRSNRNNAFGSNTGGNYSGISAGFGEIALTADPFTNKAGRDFSPNNTAGGGTLLRAAGFPGAFPSGATTSYRDVGAAQHQDSGGGGATRSPVGLSGGLA